MSVVRAVIVLACTFLVACAAVVAVDRLQHRATAARDAERQLVGLRLELAQIQDVPWGASPDEGDDPDAVRGELEWSQEHIEGTLARLDLRRRQGIVAPFERGTTALWEVLELVAKGRSDRTDAASRIAAHQLAVADREVQRAARRYRADSVRALRRSRDGTAVVIALLFGAFALVHRRAWRARRRAEQLAAENQVLLEASRVEALTDPLTGLANRRALMAELDASTGELLVALFDLNGFKQYNDTFGHPAGDALLSRLAERLATTMEGIGRAYRMGGDEFCITAPAAGPEVAALAAAALTEDGEGYAVSCSYGAALMPLEATSPGAALELADQRMYEHKA